MSNRPVPSKLAALRGNPGKRALNPNEPEPLAVLPPCPSGLSTEAKREWRRVGKALLALGLMTEVDRAALAAYCEAWSLFIDATERLHEQGPVVRGDKGPMLSPYLAVVTTAQKQMKSYLVEFGMTPSARAKLSVTAKAEEGESYEGFRKGRPVAG